ncbi:mechanosensitive ion channel family protein [Cohnella caldifontis]|uniref:mechanosensitive ion channel family protein n=1 Tax=Cohnella caldifontis TaxID=3027471 RepID=UPI0023EAE617|nr:mechanosensitive ion channel family protein [Cohnella sp. YIM B05605]
MGIERFMEAWDRFRWTEFLIAAGILVFFLILRKVFAKYLVTFLLVRFREREGWAKGMQGFEAPLRAGFILLGAYFAVHFFASGDWTYLGVWDRICRSVLILLIGWGAYNLSSASSAILEGLGRKFGLDDSSMLILFLSKVLRFIIVLLTVTAVGSEWGFSINGLVAGMGLGSLAVALAAKDSLSNILGGIVLILEKPFSKGDWIMTPTVEGVVEDITFRSSKIRTFADAVVTVPNASLADQPITNWSRMGKRRISFSLSAAPDSDPRRLARAIGRIEDDLRRNGDVDPETIMVKFNEFRDNGLGIFFYFFTKTTAWSEHLAVRQSVNLAILNVFEEEGVRLTLGSNVYVSGGSQPESSTHGETLAD